MCDCTISSRSASCTPAYQTLSGYTTIMGPWPHCEKQPALLTRTSECLPAFTTSPRRCLTIFSTSPLAGQSSPLVHTKTWVSYCPMLLRGRQRGRLLLALGDELVHFLAHGGHDLRLRHLADDLAPLEDETDALAARDADVRRARLAGTIDLASHHGDVDLLVERLELVLHLLGKGDEIDV